MLYIVLPSRILKTGQLPSTIFHVGSQSVNMKLVGCKGHDADSRTAKNAEAIDIGNSENVINFLSEPQHPWHQITRHGWLGMYWPAPWLPGNIHLDPGPSFLPTWLPPCLRICQPRQASKWYHDRPDLLLPWSGNGWTGIDAPGPIRNRKVLMVNVLLVLVQDDTGPFRSISKLRKEQKSSSRSHRLSMQPTLWVSAEMLVTPGTRKSNSSPTSYPTSFIKAIKNPPRQASTCRGMFFLTAIAAIFRTGSITPCGYCGADATNWSDWYRSILWYSNSTLPW